MLVFALIFKNGFLCLFRPELVLFLSGSNLFVRSLHLYQTHAPTLMPTWCHHAITRETWLPKKEGSAALVQQEVGAPPLWWRSSRGWLPRQPMSDWGRSPKQSCVQTCYNPPCHGFHFQQSGSLLRHGKHMSGRHSKLKAQSEKTKPQASADRPKKMGSCFIFKAH